MLANKIVRYLTLATGLAYAIIPIYMNYESLSLLTGQIAFFLLSITPFFAYFFFSRKENNLLNLLLPSLPISILYALLLSTYFESTSSTSALVFILAPVLGFGLLIVSYLTLYLISKFKRKTE
jgi:branched-subunit amino acid transport protein AzlD